MRHRAVLVGLTILLPIGLSPAGAAPGHGPAGGGEDPAVIAGSFVALVDELEAALV